MRTKVRHLAALAAAALLVAACGSGSGSPTTSSGGGPTISVNLRDSPPPPPPAGATVTCETDPNSMDVPIISATVEWEANTKTKFWFDPGSGALPEITKGSLLYGVVAGGPTPVARRGLKWLPVGCYETGTNQIQLGWVSSTGVRSAPGTAAEGPLVAAVSPGRDT
jgi:hypothetical protein